MFQLNTICHCLTIWVPMNLHSLMSNTILSAEPRSNPQLIQAIGLRVVINFYMREERSDRARWWLGPLAVGSWDLSQATIDLNYNESLSHCNCWVRLPFCLVSICSVEYLLNWKVVQYYKLYWKIGHLVFCSI